MWKLWPKAWTLGRNPADQRKAAAAEALHVRWRARLAYGLTGVLSREISEEEAPSLLDALTGEQLLALDLALRRRQWSGSSLDPRSSANSAPELWQDDDAATRFLFVATCDGIGFIREEALRQLRVYPGHLALSAALIRSTDWVPEVLTGSPPQDIAAVGAARSTRTPGLSAAARASSRIPLGRPNPSDVIGARGPRRPITLDF
jgi:hypothetical protein